MKLNADAVLAKIARLKNQLPTIIAESSKAAMEPVLEKAKELCPVVTGKLRDSARLDQDITEGRVTTTLSFNTDYAIFVHEDLTGHSPKFLERPMAEAKKDLPAKIAARLSAHLMENL